MFTRVLILSVWVCTLGQLTTLCYHFQLTPDNSNLQEKSKKVRVIGSSSYRGTGSGCFECKEQIQGKSILVGVSTRFGLSRVRLTRS